MSLSSRIYIAYKPYSLFVSCDQRLQHEWQMATYNRI